MRRPAVWCMHQTEQLHHLSFGTEGSFRRSSATRSASADHTTTRVASNATLPVTAEAHTARPPIRLRPSAPPW
jgi:hypothetical protein